MRKMVRGPGMFEQYRPMSDEKMACPYNVFDHLTMLGQQAFSQADVVLGFLGQGMFLLKSKYELYDCDVSPMMMAKPDRVIAVGMFEGKLWGVALSLKDA